MTVTLTTNKVSPQEGNGVTTKWSFNFVINESSELEVFHTDANGVETKLEKLEKDKPNETGKYTVNVSSYPGNGSITYPTSGTKVATDEYITMRRVVTIDQTTVDLNNQGGYFPEIQETAHDRGIMIAQQLREELDVSGRRKEGENGHDG